MPFRVSGKKNIDFQSEICRGQFLPKQKELVLPELKNHRLISFPYVRSFNSNKLYARNNYSVADNTPIIRVIKALSRANFSNISLQESLFYVLDRQMEMLQRLLKMQEMAVLLKYDDSSGIRDFLSAIIENPVMKEEHNISSYSRKNLTSKLVSVLKEI